MSYILNKIKKTFFHPKMMIIAPTKKKHGEKLVCTDGWVVRNLRTFSMRVSVFLAQNDIQILAGPQYFFLFASAIGFYN